MDKSYIQFECPHCKHTQNVVIGHPFSVIDDYENGFAVNYQCDECKAVITILGTVEINSRTTNWTTKQ